MCKNLNMTNIIIHVFMCMLSNFPQSGSGVTSVITIIMIISLLNNYPHDGKLHLSVHLILYDNGPGISVMIPSIHFWLEAMKSCAHAEVSLCALLIYHVPLGVTGQILI